LAVGQDVPYQWFNDLAYEPLIQISPTGALVPGLATSWNYVGSGYKTFDLFLRSGVKFSDGTALTAQGVVDWLNYDIKNGNGATAYKYATSITAVGPLEVQIQLSVGNPALPSFLSPTNDTSTYVMSDAALNTPATLASMSNATDGAGPYEFDPSESTTNTTYTYIPNPNYYDPSSVYWSKVVIDIIPNQNTMLAALEDGQIDVAEGSSSVAPAAKSAGFKVVSEPNNLYNMDITDPGGNNVKALGNPKVREALDYATDRPGILNALFGKYGTTDDETGGVGSAGVSATREHLFKYNIKMAKKLMKEAGYPHGFTANVLVTTTQLGVEQMVEAVAAEWKQIGVNLEITSPPPSEWITDLVTKKWDILAIGIPYQNLNLWLVSWASPISFFDYYDYPYPQLASLENELNTVSSSSPEATLIENTLEGRIISDGFIIPVVAQDEVLMLDKRVSNVTFNTTYPVANPIFWTPSS
jgi:peptide/nickel transport system substrate-binding protein